MCILIGAVLALVTVQEDDAGAAELVIRLRSDSLEEREKATRRLKEMGKAALPALEKAARDKDVEVASRARHLLKVHGVREKLSEGLLKAMPGVEDRLAAIPVG